ncbi:MAG: type I-E CRISPR-associated protein Cse2/CasB [Peptococcaceae bacterium]|nr:type I-E CRISPR-associated protein Cse2/CasB [Peptococcaceae bacterium]
MKTKDVLEILLKQETREDIIQELRRLKQLLASSDISEESNEHPST